MKLVAGNWKMNGSAKKAERLAEALVERHRAGRIKPAVLLCPPAHLLQRVCSVIAGSGLQLGAQDCSDEAGPGAFTGEISASQLIDVDCNYVIVGHSERRQRHGETNEVVAAKAAQALAVGLIPIVCVGESLAEREAGEAARVVRRQVRESLPPSADTLLVVIAYEPVWAIGTGRTPSNEDIAEMHGALRGEAGAGGCEVTDLPRR